MTIHKKERKEINFEVLFVKCVDYDDGDDINHFLIPIPIPNIHEKKDSGTHYNVIHLIIDATSRRQWEALMYKTSNTMMNLKNSRLFRMNNLWVNGWNSRPNKLRQVCYNNDCKDSMIKRYNESGYKTAWLNEYSRLCCGQYNDVSFQNKLKDNNYGVMGYPFYDMRRIGVDHLIAGDYMERNWGKDSANLYFEETNPYSSGCAHQSQLTELLLTYVSDMTELYSKYYVVLMSFIAHSTDYMRLSLIDSQLSNTLRKWDNNVLKDTIVVISGDHGIHYSAINSFESGEYEHRNPVFDILVPHTLLEKTPEVINNLKHNQHQLLTHHDIFETINNFRYFEKGRLSEYKNRKGYDLFNQKVPSNRTCMSADIPKEWCNCFTKIQTQDSE